MISTPDDDLENVNANQRKSLRARSAAEPAISPIRCSCLWRRWCSLPQPWGCLTDTPKSLSTWLYWLCSSTLFIENTVLGIQYSKLWKVILNKPLNKPEYKETSRTIARLCWLHIFQVTALVSVHFANEMVQRLDVNCAAVLLPWVWSIFSKWLDTHSMTLCHSEHSGEVPWFYPRHICWTCWGQSLRLSWLFGALKSKVYRVRFWRNASWIYLSPRNCGQIFIIESLSCNLIFDRFPRSFFCMNIAFVLPVPLPQHLFWQCKTNERKVMESVRLLGKRFTDVDISWHFPLLWYLRAITLS